MSSTLTPARLIDTPLPELLTELGARVIDATIEDPEFFGALSERAGQLTVQLPSGRPEWERDTVARMLLGQWAGVELAPLPKWLELTELVAA